MCMIKYLEVINKFINILGYRNNIHYLGTYFYGSSLTGFNNSNSDIDLHIIFDNSDIEHIYKEKCPPLCYLITRVHLHKKNA